MKPLHLAFLLLLGCASAGQPGHWSGAWCNQCQSGYSSAVPAVCPSENPVSCSSIQEPGYCCPAENYCTGADSRVACCPDNCDCSSWEPQSSRQPESTWRPHSTWHSRKPSTTWCDECEEHTRTVYVGGGQTTQYWGTTTTSGAPWDGEYCSTMYANGPNLPTTGAAQCGTVLIIQADEAARYFMGWARLIALVVGLHLLGGVLLVWR